MAAVGPSVTDDYSNPSYAALASPQGVLTNEQMNSVLGEARYEPITFPDQNQVGDVYVYGDGANYCSGCNGNFKLGFANTSLTVGDGVFGVGVDIVFHTSRRSSVGDVIPGQTSDEGTVMVEFKNGQVEFITIPADVGFFGPEVFFFGLTDNRGIESLTIGTEPASLRHSWVIDNLTIGGRRVPEPTTLALLGLGLAGLVFTLRGRPAH